MIRIFPLISTLVLILSCNMTTSCSTARTEPLVLKVPCKACAEFQPEKRKEYLAKIQNEYKASKSIEKKDLIIRDLYFKAINFEDNYALKESEEIFQLLHRLKPNDAHLSKKYILGLIKNGAIEKALTELEELSEYNLDAEDRSELMQLKANVYESTGDFDQAIKVYDSILKADASNIDVCLKRAFLAVDQSTESAIKILNVCHQASKSDDHKAEVSFKIGRLYLDVGDLDRSSFYFNRAYREFPENSKSLAAVGVILIETDKKDKAIANFKNHLKVFPDDYLVSKRLMDHYVSEEKFSNALPYLEKMVDLNPKDPSVKFKLAYLYKEIGKVDESIQAINEVLPFGVDTDKSHFFLGDLYIQKKNFTAAVNSFSKIKPESTYYAESKIREVTLLRDLALENERTTASSENKKEDRYLSSINKIKKESEDRLSFDLDVNQAIYFKRKANYKRSIQILTKIKDHKNFRDDHKFFLASMYEKENLYKNADEIVLKMLLSDPENAQAHNYYGYSLIERDKKDLEMAKVHLNKAIDLKPNDPHILDSVGWLYYHLGEYQKSIGYFLKARDQGLEKDFTVNKHLGMSYQKLGQQVSAEKYFRISLTNAVSDKEKREINNLLTPFIQKMPASI